MKKKKTGAQLIGGVFAQVQHGVDSALSWGFKKLRAAGSGEEPEGEETRHPYVRTARKAGKGLLTFFGELGDAYYDKYSELKKEGKPAQKPKPRKKKE